MSKIYCHKCGFPNNNEKANFCEYCGTSVINKCSNTACDSNHILSGGSFDISPEARYCYHCGSETTFKQIGAFDK